MEMQAIILATDEQRTLSPLTDTLPGPMLPIVDRPVMARTVEILARAGQKQILMSLYERGGQIAAYFGSGRRWGVEIKYVTQRQALGTAGALRWASGLLRETLLVLPGDSICDFDLEAALHFHRSRGAAATAILHAPRPGAAAPAASLDAEGRLQGFGETSTGGDELQFTGALILEPDLLHQIPATGNYDIVTGLLPALIAGGEELYGYKTDGYWNPLDSLEAYQEAQEVCLYSAFYQQAPEQASGGPAARLRFPSLEARPIAPGIWVGRDHSIHPTVKLAAPVHIGHNNWIGREVELASGTVLGSNVVIDDEATVNRSTVLSNVYVGRLVRIEHKIVAADSISDPATGATTRVVDPFLIARVGAAAEGRSPLRRLVSGAVALGLIVALSPCLLLVGLLTTLVTGGRMFVREPRVGQRAGGTSTSLITFQVTRFRTRRGDGSFVPFGHLLERWELHRLPELFHVLSGDLALVGVKPLRPDEAARLTEEWHQRRHDAPAGLTGLWYLQTDILSELDTVIVTDVYYAATRSLRGDMLILLQTPGAWLRKRHRPGESASLVQADNVGSM